VNGHGPDYKTEDLKQYLDVGTTTQNLIRDKIEQGQSVDDILQSGLLSRWRKWGEGVVSEEDWVRCVYQQHLKETHRQTASISKPLTEAIVKDGIEAAVRLYSSLKQNQPDEFDFSENQLNNLGYQLLYRDRLTDAIEIFKLNLSAYPESGNVYDSLAEAYMNHGDNALAVEFYRKSLEKDPTNANARAMLSRLGYKP
jgi:tetratricopeptide (TPR) repeat protein